MSLLSTFTIYFAMLWCHCIGAAVQIPVCKNFSSKTSSISLPTNVVSGVVYGFRNLTAINFQLASNTELKCNGAQASTKKIRLDQNYNIIDDDPVEPRDYRTNNSKEAHSQSYFTSLGYFYDNQTTTYYRPSGDYCVESVSEAELTLKVCAVNKHCNVSALPNAWCVPKCCAIDEVYLYGDHRCVKRNETEGTTPWLPQLFHGPTHPHNLVSSDKISQNVLFQLANLPEHCAQIIMQDDGSETHFYMHFTGSRVEHFNNSSLSKQGESVRLALPEGHVLGTIRTIGLSLLSRKWVHLEDQFCVDEISDQSKSSNQTYAGNSHHFIIIYCYSNEYEEESTNVSWAYFGISLVALLFLTAILVVYIALWKEQNLHGLTIISYTVATLGSYLFLSVAHLLSLYPETLGKAFGLGDRGLPCYLIAVLAHYFFFASYLWLTLMNFDLWLTFRKVRVVKRDQKEWGKFGWYSLVAWIFPLLLIIAFIGVNEDYRNAMTEVPVPDYTQTSCFVSAYFRGEYLYTPMGILLGLNILLIIITMWIFVKARRKAGKTFNNGTTNDSGYSAKLFLKLFVVMGGTSLVDVITWYYNNNGYKHWFFVVIENISYLQPIALFIIFCLTSRVISQLRNKYPNFMRRLDPILKVFDKQDRENTVSTNEFSNATNKTSCSMDTLNRKRENVPLTTL